MNSDQAFQLVLDREGGYSNNRMDPGGETMYGITARVARRHGYMGDMRLLPLELAKIIFRDEYWNGVRGSDLPDDLRFDMTDFAYQSGPQRATQFLQEIAGVAADGIPGPITIAAAAKLDPLRAALVLNGQRLYFLTTLPTWGSFSRGWARRIANNLKRFK